MYKIKNIVKKTILLTKVVLHKTFYFLKLNCLFNFILFDLRYSKNIEDFLSQYKNLFFYQPNNKNGFRKIYFELFGCSYNKVKNLAELACKNRFYIFEFEVKFKNKIKWHYDLLAKRECRSSPFAFVSDFKKITDIRFRAEFLRLQHFFHLGKAYFLEENEVYAKTFKSHLLNWENACLSLKPLYFFSPLEEAIRIFTLFWCLFFFQDSKNITSDFLKKILRIISIHANYIKHNMQHSQYPNNHLIGEATGLVLAGYLMKSFKISTKWFQTGYKILIDQLFLQIDKEGVHKEQAIAYHVFVLNFYIHFLLICNKLGYHISKEAKNRIEKMFEFIMYISLPTGYLPMIGDSDDGSVTKLGQIDGLNVKELLAVGAVLYERGDFKKISKNYSEVAFWLLGIDGYRKYNNLQETDPQETSKAFFESGNFIMRTGWNEEAYYLYFDCGPQGWGEAGHGHADCLSFILYAFGKPLIIDPGTYRYNGAYNWRCFFRGTSAHNTIVVDDLDQSVSLPPPDPFGWTFTPTSKLHYWVTTQKFDLVDGEHNGYERLENPITHRRKILFIKGEYWLISDLLTGQGKHKFDCYFHFPPGKVLLNEHEGSLCTLFEKVNIKIVYLKDKYLKATIIEGSENPIQGWVSYTYGTKLKAPVLNLQKITEAPTFFHTILFPFKENQVPYIKIKRLLNMGFQQGLKINFLNHTDYFFYCNEDKSLINFEDLTTDAEMIFLRKKDGIIKNLFLLNGSFIKDKKGIFFSTKSKLRFVSFYYNNEIPVFELPSKEVFNTYFKTFEIKP